MVTVYNLFLNVQFYFLHSSIILGAKKTARYLTLTQNKFISFTEQWKLAILGFYHMYPN